MRKPIIFSSVSGIFYDYERKTLQERDTEESLTWLIKRLQNLHDDVFRYKKYQLLKRKT